MEIIPKIFNKKMQLMQILVFCFFILLNFQQFGIDGIIIHSSESTIKLYHVFSVIFLPFILLKMSRGFYLPRFSIILFFIVIVVTSLFSYTASIELEHTLLIHYIYAFYMFILGQLLYEQYGEAILTPIRAAILSIIFIVLIKNFVYTDAILTYLRDPYGHPVIFYFYGGGPNLEATWLGLSVLFFYNTRWFYALSLLSTGISIIYGSRVGLIISFLVLFFQFLSPAISKMKKFTLCLMISFACILLVMLNPYLIERFLQIGNESGSLGRLKMWQYIYDAFATSPFFGYGAGNAIVAIENVSNYDFWEDNVHNYYAQTLLDFGIVGFLIFLSVMCFVFIKELKRRFSNFLGGYILIFGIASLVQFRGAEAIFWFVFGLYQGQIIWNRRKTLNDQNSSTYTSL